MTTLNFKIVRDAGIPVAHFAILCDASRITAATWLSGKHSPRGLYAKRAAKVLTMIEQAMSDQKLPLPRTARGDKFAALTKALAS